MYNEIGYVTLNGYIYSTNLTISIINQKDLDHQMIDETDIVINVAGCPVLDKRQSWNENFKREIIASRINTTGALADAIEKSNKPPRAFITISGVGYYPPHPTKTYTERSDGGKGDFFADLCKKWEEAATLPASHPTRQVIIRSGVVLGNYGGMIKELSIPFMLGLGGPMGTGKQWMPWIHIDDLASMFMFAAEEDNVKGILNGVAPQTITNEEFVKAYARALWRPALIRLPEIVFNLMFSDERAKMITDGQKVVPQRVQELGFIFNHSTIDDACKVLANT